MTTTTHCVYMIDIINVQNTSQVITSKLPSCGGVFKRSSTTEKTFSFKKNMSHT